MPPKKAPSKKRKGPSSSNDKTLEKDIQPETVTPAGPLPVASMTPGKQNVAKCANNARDAVEKWIQRCLNKGIKGLQEEFAELKRYCPPDMDIKLFLEQWEAGRNRYKDVPCQEKFRVVLKWPGQAHDYIHANYVSTPISEKRFICTQGPLDNTITDFWHMVIQEDVESVVMLCNILEKGMNKCAQYWPLDEKQVQTWADVEILNTVIRTLPLENAVVRLSVLIVKWQENGVKKEREVRHYQWIDWPDRGVPVCRSSAMMLLSYIRGTKKPIVVHCSAGIGRTGTIVAIEFILERLQSGMQCEAMDEILKELRNQRPYSIQTDLQYLYVHRVMLYYFFEKYKVANNEDSLAKYKKFLEDYTKATA